MGEITGLASGGVQEGGLRPGTLPTHQIAGMGAAARLARECLAEDGMRIQALDARFLRQLKHIEDISVNGDPTIRAPGILNVAFSGISAESLMVGLPEVAFSAGSACTSEAIEPSHVLLALGFSDNRAHSSIRFSLGKYTTEAEVDFVASRVADAVLELRSIAA